MKKFVYTVLLLICLNEVYSQDIHFSQLSETPLLVNPANTGFFDGYMRADLNYRTQWSSAGSPFKTMAATVDAELGLKKNKTGYLGVGGFVYQDKAGDANWKQFKTDLYLNGILRVGKESHIALGIGGGYGQNSADYSKLTFGNQYNGKEFTQELPSLETIVFRNFSYADLAAGTVFEYDKTSVNFDHNNLFALRVGVAAFHLNQPVLKYGGSLEQRLMRKYIGSLYGRYDFKGSNISLITNNVYMMQGKFSQINTGITVRLRFADQTKVTGIRHETALCIGMYTRVNDALIPQISFEMRGFNVGFSYDYNISPYKSSTRGIGAFEVSLRWINLRDGLFRQGREFGGSGKNTATPTP